MRRICLVLFLVMALVVACESDSSTTSTPDLGEKQSQAGARTVRGKVFNVGGGEGEGIANSRVKFQVARGGELVVDGEASARPDGSFAIGVYVEQGDLITLQAKAPGYLSSNVHLTWEQIDAGELAQIGMELQANDALIIVGHEWKPTRLSLGIQERLDGTDGGLLAVYVRNVRPLPVEIDALTVNDLDVEEQIEQRLVRWSRLRPEPIPAGGMGVWELCLSDEPADVQVGLHPRNALPLEAALDLSPSPISISYATWNEAGDGLLVFVHNRDDRALFEIEDVFLNGELAQARVYQAEIGPGETALVAVTPGFGRELLATAYCLVKGRIFEGEPGFAWAAIQSHAPTFPIGTRPDSTELDETVLADLEEHGIDTLVLELPQSSSDAVWRRVTESSDMGVIGIPKFPASRDQVSAFGDNPRLLAWFISDEPELHLNRDLFGVFDLPYDAGDDSEDSWRLAPAFADAEKAYRQVAGPPTYVNYGSYRLLPKYAPIPDIAGVAHYAIDAPGANFRGSHALEEVFTYTLGLRDHASPSPIWPWVQAMCSTSWYENTGACWNRLPTASEMRAQLYLQLAAGAKGVLWFTHRSAFVEGAAEQWSEVGRQNRLIAALKEYLLYGDVSDTVVVGGGRGLARAIVSEHVVVIPLVNLDYDWQERIWADGQDPPLPSPPYEFHEREDVVLSVLVPEWIHPQTAMLVTPEGISELPWESAARAVTLTLPMLDDVAMLVVSDQDSLMDELQARLEP